jgi:hypothetical protein
MTFFVTFFTRDLKKEEFVETLPINKVKRTHLSTQYLRHLVNVLVLYIQTDRDLKNSAKV